MKKRTSATKGLKLAFVLGTAAILLVALAISNVLDYLFLNFNSLPYQIALEKEWYIVLIFTATSIFIGLGLAFILGRIIFKPMTIITDGLSKLSEGDYSERIYLGGYDSMNDYIKHVKNVVKNKMVLSANIPVYDYYGLIWGKIEPEEETTASAHGTTD